MELSERNRGSLLFILGMLCFALMGALVKGVSHRLPPFEIAFFRVSINLAFVTPILAWRGLSFIGRRPRLLLRRSLAGCLALTLSFYAVSHIRLVDAAVLHKTSVFFTPLLAVLMLHEKVSLRLIILSAVGFLGAVLIIKPSFDVVNLGGLAGLSAGLLTALVMVTIRELHDSEHSLTIVFSFSAISTILLGAVFGNQFLRPEGREWVMLFGLGTAGTCGQVLFTKAYRFATASHLAPLSLVEVLVAAVVGFLFFAEIPDVWSICGAAMITGAGVMLLWPNRDAELKTGH